MTRDEAIQKLIDTADLVAFVNGRPHVANDEVLASDDQPNDWEEWKSITILHKLNGKEALEVYRALKEKKIVLAS